MALAPVTVNQGWRRGEPKLLGEKEHVRVIHPLGSNRTSEESSEWGIRQLPVSWALISFGPQPLHSGLFPPLYNGHKDTCLPMCYEK